ncbi:LysR family transcriptional regulator, partial [Candidatus Endoriftia persephone str. Guaymas]|nr:LysR family transcriptional regulator [Candidatus Endoriftia persephone str. Guaymas]
GNKNLVVEVCRKDQLVAIVPPSHVLAERDSVGFKELIEYPFICREEGSGTREVINEYMCHQLGNCNNGLTIAMELGSPESVKGAVEAGMGVSVVSRASIQKELKLDTLRAIPLDPPLERPFS